MVRPAAAGAGNQGTAALRLDLQGCSHKKCKCRARVGTVMLPEGPEMVMPGDNLKFNVKLIAPITMEEKLCFGIREDSRTVGAGVVTKILA